MEEKVDPCSVRILFSCWSLGKKWVKICLSRLNYPILYCPQRKAIKFPMPPKGFPPQRDCPLKINNLAFLCWWQSQERAGGGFFFFMLIFFLFCITLPSPSPHRWFPYIALNPKPLHFDPLVVTWSTWFKRQRMSSSTNWIWAPTGHQVCTRSKPKTSETDG